MLRRAVEIFSDRFKAAEPDAAAQGFKIFERSRERAFCPHTFFLRDDMFECGEEFIRGSYHVGSRRLLYRNRCMEKKSVYSRLIDLCAHFFREQEKVVPVELFAEPEEELCVFAEQKALDEPYRVVVDLPEELKDTAIELLDPSQDTQLAAAVHLFAQQAQIPRAANR